MNTSQRGIALLIAALISAVVISIGVALYSIVQKQLILSSLARDSQFAFYSADTSAECGLYYDSRWSYFAATTTPPTLPTNQPPVCDGQTLSITRPGSVSYPYISTFQYAPNGKCVFVIIMKCDGIITDASRVAGCTRDVVNTPPPVHTAILAYGYNVPCNATTTSNRVLQRSVQLNY